MSDESPPPQGPRLKLKLRTDRPLEGTSAPPSDAPAPSSSQGQVAERPTGAADSAANAETTVPPGGGPAASPPSPIKLKPRVVIKPSEPDPASGSGATPGAPPAIPAASPATPGPERPPSEKIEIDIAPPGKLLGTETPVGNVAAARPAGAEKAESSFKFKLKPASGKEMPAASIPSDLGGAKAAEPTGIRPLSAGLSMSGLTAAKPAHGPVAQPPAAGTSAPPRRSLRALLGVGAALVVVCAGAYYWFFVRAPSPASNPAAAVRPAPSAAKQRPPAAAATLPAPVNAATALHPVVAGALPGKAPPVAPAALPAKTAAVQHAPPAPGALTAVKPMPVSTPAPPPPVASLQFRAYVDHLKINGVRAGPPARLVVDGAAFDQGDVMNSDLGVVFFGVDPNTGEILFKDASGVILRRRF